MRMMAHFGDDPCPELWRSYWVADSDISISRENHEEEGAGDLVDRSCGVVDLAHGRAKWPFPHYHSGDEERNSN